MKTLLCLVNCMAGISLASAQSPHYLHSPLLVPTGAYSARFSDLFSFLGNTGALAQCTRMGAGVYAENKFGLKALNNYTAAAQMPLSYGAIGFVTTYSGSVEFNRSQIGLAYAKNLGRINLGVRFNYHMVRLAGYGSAGAITLELGSTWQITQKLYSGMQVTNPKGGDMPSVYSVGMGYECSEHLYINTTITKEENKAVNVSAGLQYIIDKFLLMIGINSSTSSPSLAAGWKWKDMCILAGGSFHPQLGASTNIGFIFSARKKDD